MAQRKGNASAPKTQQMQATGLLGGFVTQQTEGTSFEETESHEVILSMPIPKLKNNKATMKVWLLDESGNKLSPSPMMISPTFTNCLWPAQSDFKFPNGPCKHGFRATLELGKLNEVGRQRDADRFNRTKRATTKARTVDDVKEISLISIEFNTPHPLVGLERFLGPMFAMRSNMNRNAAQQGAPVVMQSPAVQHNGFVGYAQNTQAPVYTQNFVDYAQQQELQQQQVQQGYPVAPGGQQMMMQQQQPDVDVDMSMVQNVITA